MRSRRRMDSAPVLRTPVRIEKAGSKPPPPRLRRSTEACGEGGKTRPTGPANHRRQGYGGPPKRSAKAEAGHYVLTTMYSRLRTHDVHAGGPQRPALRNSRHPQAPPGTLGTLGTLGTRLL